MTAPSAVGEARGEVTVARAPAAGRLLAIPGFVAMSFSNGLVHASSMRLQGMIVAWLVLDMTGSKLWLGIVSGVPALAAVGFVLLGGALADSRDVRRTLIVSRSLLAATAFIAAVLASSGQMGLPSLMVYVLVSMSLMAADMPMARTLVLHTVGTGRLVRAGAANLVTLNLINVMGPLAVGWLIGRTGAQPAVFILFGAFALATWLILRVPPAEVQRERRPANPLPEIVAGLAYVRATPVVAALLGLGFLIMLPGVYFGLVPVYAREVLRVGPEGLGVLTASFSAGTLTGATWMMTLSGLRRRGMLVAVLSVVFSAGMIVFALSTDLVLSCGASFAMGVTAAFWQNLLGAMVQTAAAPEMRGRTVAIFTMGYQLANVGWLVGGVLATLLSVQAAVLMAAVAFGGIATLIFAVCREAREID
jgi:MFS family permease